MLKKEEIEKEIIQVRSKFEKDKNFKKYYVNGAIGGFKNKYDFRLAFYDTEINDLIIQTDPIKFNKDLSKEEKLNLMNQLEIKNNILCEIIMAEQAVKELYAFLGKELEKLKRIKESGKFGLYL